MVWERINEIFFGIPNDKTQKICDYFDALKLVFGDWKSLMGPRYTVDYIYVCWKSIYKLNDKMNTTKNYSLLF